jgi:hypothetical protein
MSNSDPSAIVLQGMPCIGGLYIRFDSNGAEGFGVVEEERGGWSGVSAQWNGPQGLKPVCLLALIGTAEAVPFPETRSAGRTP